MTSQTTPQFGLCIDWETSGANFGEQGSAIEFQGLSIGVVVFDLKTLSPVETLYKEIKFDSTKYKWQDYAESIHGMSREYLEEHGVTQEEAAIDVASLILKYFDPQKPILFLGHNREFDISFTKQLLEPFDLMFKIHHVVLDTAGIGLITMGFYKSNLLFESLGFEARGKHNALEDALMTLESCQRIRMLINSALGV